VPPGTYKAEIRSELVRKPSQFDQAKTYCQLDLNLEAPTGEWFVFPWSFSPRNPIFGELLLVLGGKRLPSGVISHPRTYAGKPFLVEIIQRPGKTPETRSKTYNEIVAVKPCVEEPEPEDPEEISDDPPF
jgi:hypothetical protein